MISVTFHKFDSAGIELPICMLTRVLNPLGCTNLTSHDPCFSNIRSESIHFHAILPLPQLCQQQFLCSATRLNSELNQIHLTLKAWLSLPIIFTFGDGDGTEAEIQLPLKRSSRFQRLFPNPSWLV